MKTQVDKTHYNFASYATPERWASYYNQIDEALKCRGKNVLYIGVGDNIVVDTLKKFGKNVKTLDFASDLKPDYTGSVTDIKKVLNKDAHKFDVIICSQVLEHIPFDQFEKTISQLSDCVKEKLILSLPNSNKHFRVFISKPLKMQLHIYLKNIFAKKWDINDQGHGEHYWEIDAKGCPSRKDIVKIINKYFTLENFYIPFNNTYHMFFILKK